MSLVRAAIALSLAVAVVPSDPAAQRRLYDNAAAATTWTLTFCERNPATCTQAHEMWQVFLAKAEVAARSAYAITQEQSTTQAASPTVAPPARGTLTAADVATPWRGRSGG